ncbi:hypothetical protein ACMFMF_009822 [Clarireedia jacksonii]
MLPKLDWWELGSTISNTLFFARNSYQFYLDGNLSSIYPWNITAAMIPEACNYNNLSLAQNLSSILSRTLSVFCFHAFDIDDLKRPSLVIASATTLSDNIFFLTEFLIPYYYQQRWPLQNIDREISSSSIGDWTVQFLPKAFQLDTKTAALWQQPVVTTSCLSENIEPAVRSLSVLNMSYLFDYFSEQTAVNAEYLFTILNRLNDVDIVFLEIAILYITPRFNESAVFLYRSHNVTHICLVHAHWENSTIEASHGLDINVDVIANSYTGERIDSVGGNINDTPISISTDWLVSLNMGTVAQHDKSTSFFNALIDLCARPPKLELNNDSEDGYSNLILTPDIECMTTGFSLAITEGLSKLPHNSDVYALGTSDRVEYWDGLYGNGFYGTGYLGPVMRMNSWYNWFVDDLEYGFVGGDWINVSITEAQKAGFTRFDFAVKQRLYGYGFRSITVYLSFVVLFLYTLTVMVHMLFLLAGQRWSSGAWSSLG